MKRDPLSLISAGPFYSRLDYFFFLTAIIATSAIRPASTTIAPV